MGRFFYFCPYLAGRRPRMALEWSFKLFVSIPINSSRLTALYWIAVPSFSVL